MSWDLTGLCHIRFNTVDLFNKRVELVSNPWNPFDLSDMFKINDILLIYPSNPRYIKRISCIKLISYCSLFFLTYCDWLFVILRYTLILNDYLWCSYSLFLNFILNIFICLFFYNFFPILIKFDKQVDMTNSFNK